MLKLLAIAEFVDSTYESLGELDSTESSGMTNDSIFHINKKKTQKMD